MTVWRLRDLLPQATIDLLVAARLLEPEQIPESDPEAAKLVAEIWEKIEHAAKTKGAPLTQSELRHLMLDFPGRQPPGTRLERRGHRFHQTTSEPGVREPGGR